MHDLRARSVADRSSAPASILPSRRYAPIALHLQESDHAHATVASFARPFMRRVIVCFVTFAASFIFAGADTGFAGSSTRAQTAARSEAVDRSQVD